MRKFLWLSLLAIGLGFGAAPRGVRADNQQLFHSVVTVSATTVPVSIPASSQCSIANPGSGYTGTVSVYFRPSSATTSFGPLPLWLDAGPPSITAFTPSAGATRYFIYPGVQGTVSFIGTGGTGTTAIPFDCNTLPPSIASIVPTPGSGGAFPTPSSVPTTNPSPVPGYLQQALGFYAGSGGAGVGQTKEYVWSTNGFCTWAALGASGTNAVDGIKDETAGLYCGNSLLFSFDHNGSFAANNLYAAVGDVVAGCGSNCPTGIDGSSLIVGEGGNSYGSIYIGSAGTAGTNYCRQDWNRTHSGTMNWGCSLYAPNITDTGLAASASVCTNSSKTLTTSGCPAVPATTGVPTGAGTVGQVVSLTDGGAGAQLYGYVGQYTGLPYVTNYGTSAGASASVPMQRTIVQGDLLVAFISCCNTVQWSASSGWTAIYNNGGPTPANGAAYKIAGSGDVGTSITPFSLSSTDVSISVLEVANFNATTPIVQSSTAGGSACLSGVAANDLVLLSPDSANSGQGVVPRGAMPTPWVGSVGGGNNQIAYGIAMVPSVYNGTEICTGTMQGTNASGIVEVGAGTGTTNLWLPI